MATVLFPILQNLSIKLDARGLYINIFHKMENRDMNGHQKKNWVLCVLVVIW